MTTQELEQQVTDLTQDLFRASNRTFTPQFPWVMVRKLARDNMYKGLIALPQHEQNKVTHEGVVVATWKPKTIEKGVKEGSKTITRVTIQKSQLSIGQHVLFPHWAGQPAFGFDPDKYRLVKECDWQVDKEGGIIGVVDYGESAMSTMAKLTEILGIDTEGVALAHRIQDQFIVIDKDQKALGI